MDSALVSVGWPLALAIVMSRLFRVGHRQSVAAAFEVGIHPARRPSPWP